MDSVVVAFGDVIGDAWEVGVSAVEAPCVGGRRSATDSVTEVCDFSRRSSGRRVGKHSASNGGEERDDAEGRHCD